MSTGERPIGAAKGKQPNTETLCQPPLPPCPPRHPLPCCTPNGPEPRAGPPQRVGQHPLQMDPAPLACPRVGPDYAHHHTHAPVHRVCKMASALFSFNALAVAHCRASH